MDGPGHPRLGDHPSAACTLICTIFARIADTLCWLRPPLLRRCTAELHSLCHTLSLSLSLSYTLSLLRSDLLLLQAPPSDPLGSLHSMTLAHTHTSLAMLRAQEDIILLHHSKPPHLGTCDVPSDPVKRTIVIRFSLLRLPESPTRLPHGRGLLLEPVDAAVATEADSLAQTTINSKIHTSHAQRFTRRFHFSAAHSSPCQLHQVVCPSLHPFLTFHHLKRTVTPLKSLE